MAETPSWVESREDQEVVRNRRVEACEAGLSRVEADLFARSDLDVGELRRLVASGCPPELICKILF